MYLFVTVGSHKFDELIEYMDTEEFHHFLKKLGFAQMTMQIGSSSYIPKLIYKNNKNNNINNNNKKEEDDDNGYNLLKKVKYFTYQNDLNKFYDKADLIVSHGGAGTTFECLRKNKKILLVVNKKLMNNHQMEFAHFMGTSNYVEICISLETLMENIYTCLKKKSYSVFPKPNNTESFLRDLQKLMHGR
ncbi:glycosyltransferase family 28 protein, putative [Plasmodium malariae]|uniref:UDP-N-acetylglucosamine transferase subunit ALG13 n=1 Tax=Plasmodium malariae TaxID=5858 RepID=A0A1C3KLB8_PLAMA|nr:glycosyltransferase family 28 protein, putative [Plasmodium malariae]